MGRKGSKDLIEDQFYKTLPLSDVQAYRPGQLYWAHLSYPFDWPRVVAPKAREPDAHERYSFKIKRYSTGDEKLHVPIRDMSLEADELLYVYKGKKRLGVVLAQIEATWITTNKSEGENLCLVAPLFTFKDRHRQRFIWKTQAFRHRNLFYLPSDVNGCAEEGAARLEMIQPTSTCIMEAYRAPLDSKLVCLTEPVYSMLITHLLRFLCSPDYSKELADDMDAYGDLLMEEAGKMEQSG